MTNAYSSDDTGGIRIWYTTIQIFADLQYMLLGRIKVKWVKERGIIIKTRDENWDK
jgi:hypothetical protein